LNLKTASDRIEITRMKEELSFKEKIEFIKDNVDYINEFDMATIFENLLFDSEERIEYRKCLKREDKLKSLLEDE
jgi:hypothetical protein